MDKKQQNRIITAVIGLVVLIAGYFGYKVVVTEEPKDEPTTQQAGL